MQVWEVFIGFYESAGGHYGEWPPGGAVCVCLWGGAGEHYVEWPPEGAVGVVIVSGRQGALWCCGLL